MFQAEIVRFAPIQKPSDFASAHASPTLSSRNYDPSELVCETCGKRFDTRGNLRRHKKTKHLLPYRCVICDKKFGLSAGLTRHFRSRHELKTQVICPFQQCGKRFSRKDHLARHIKSSHAKDIGSESLDSTESTKWLIRQANEDAERRIKALAPLTEVSNRFLQAVVDRDVSKVESLLSTNNAVLTSSEIGTKAVRLAAEKDFEDVLESLLIHNYDLAAPLEELAAAGSETGVNLLFLHGAIAESSQGLRQAIKRDDVGIVQAYIRNGLAIDSEVSNAVKYRARAILKLLLQHGASAHLQMVQAALWESVSQGQADMLRTLLSLLSDPSELQYLQRHLNKACRTDPDSISVIEVLLDYCASTTQLFDVGDLLLRSVSSSHDTLLKLLLMSDVVSKPIAALVNALNLAYAIDDREMKSLLLARLQLTNPPHAFDNIIRAAEEKAIMTDDLLFSQIASFGHVETVTKLLDSGANADAKDKHGRSCLITASEQKNLAVMELFLNHGADTNEQEDDGRTALHHSCIGSCEFQKQAVEMLLSKGASANLGSGQKAGTPLMDLARSGTEVQHLLFSIQLLNKHGADVNLTGSAGYTPTIWLSRRMGHSATVALLLKLGANPNHRTDSGMTALISSCESLADPETTKVLLEAGASIHIKNNAGETALSLCCQEIWYEGSRRKLKLLLEHGDGIDPRSPTFTYALHRVLRIPKPNTFERQMIDYMYSYARSRDSEFSLHNLKTNSPGTSSTPLLR